MEKLWDINCRRLFKAPGDPPTGVVPRVLSQLSRAERKQSNKHLLIVRNRRKLPNLPLETFVCLWQLLRISFFAAFNCGSDICEERLKVRGSFRGETFTISTPLSAMKTRRNSKETLRNISGTSTRNCTRKYSLVLVHIWCD